MKHESYKLVTKSLTWTKNYYEILANEIKNSSELSLDLIDMFIFIEDVQLM